MNSSKILNTLQKRHDQTFINVYKIEYVQKYVRPMDIDWRVFVN